MPMVVPGAAHSGSDDDGGRFCCDDSNGTRVHPSIAIRNDPSGFVSDSEQRRLVQCESVSSWSLIFWSWDVPEAEVEIASTEPFVAIVECRKQSCNSLWWHG